jgi:hypothetical protein
MVKNMLKLTLRMERVIGAAVLGFAIIVGCLFLYWSIEYYVSRTFDAGRYELIPLPATSNGSLYAWKLDRRTGGLDLCGKSNNRVGYLACLTAVQVNAEEFLRISEVPAPVVVAPAAPATAAAPVAAPAQPAKQPVKTR